MIKIFFKQYALIISIAFFSLFFLSFDNDKDFEITKNLDIFYTLFKELDIYYVDEINPGQLIKTGIDEMLASLDPYTNYIPESKLEDFKFMTTGHYGGVGASIRDNEGQIIVTDIYKDYPAYKAGIKIGDRIIKIDGKDVTGKNSEEISDLLRGQPGTKFQIEINRIGQANNIELQIIREKIKISSVPFYGMLNNETGYIVLSSFTNECSNEIKSAFQELKKQNVKNLIIDLRSNPGGLLIEAVSISNLFISKNQEIVSTRGKYKKFDKSYSTLLDPIDTEIPIVILVNNNSASASEIVSGAFQDLDRAVVIGSKTYGKGLVQTTREISYNSKLKVTTAKYYIPSGRCIQALDYSHKKSDGSAGNIPDSLKRTFKTKNGRIVFDGGGIEPDIKISQDTLNNFMISLLSTNHLFDFASQYYLKHPELENKFDFVVDDKIINEFKDFLKEKKFEYNSKTEKELISLKNTIKQDNIDSSFNSEIDKLLVSISNSKSGLIDRNQKMIKNYLLPEIFSRYYFQEDRIKKQLKNDQYIDSALSILSNNIRYQNILKVVAKK